MAGFRHVDTESVEVVVVAGVILMNICGRCVWLVLWLAAGGVCFEGGWNSWVLADDFPDIHAVAADLQAPDMVKDALAAGRQVWQTLADWPQTEVNWS